MAKIIAGTGNNTSKPVKSSKAMSDKQTGRRAQNTTIATSAGGKVQQKVREYMQKLDAAQQPVLRGNVPIRSNYIKGAAPRATIADLYAKTPSNIRSNSRNPKCRTRFLGTVVKPNGLQNFVWRAGCSGREHITSFEVLPALTANPLQLPVRVQCSCEYFVFTLEIVMADAGLSDNRYALPQWPVIRNPNGSRHMCKHMILCTNDFAARSKNAAGGKIDNLMSSPSLVKEMDKSVTTTRKQAAERRRR